MATIETPGGAFAYREDGAGRPVVLLHASASSSCQWRSLADRLRKGNRVIAVDLPGYGETASGAASDLAGRAAVVAALAERCGEPVHLVGHSFGGAVALAAAIAVPDSIRSLTVIEPVAFNALRFGNDADRRLLREIDTLAGVIAASVASGAPEAGLAHFIDFWNGPGAFSVLPARVRVALTASVGAILDDFASGRGKEWPSDDFRSIARPTLAVMGMQSKPHAQRVTEMVAEAVPGARLHMVIDAGHMLPLTHSATVNTLVAAFLAEVDMRACSRASRALTHAA